MSKVNRTFKTFLIILLILLSICRTNPVSAEANVWKGLGPESAAINGLAVDPQLPTTLYIGTDYGVYKSTDGGANWTAINAGFVEQKRYQVLAIDPLTTSTLYVGTNDGLYKSMDGGANWTPSYSGITSIYGLLHIITLVIDPLTPSTLYAGTPENLFKSTNGGASWTLVSFGLNVNSSVHTLVIDPLTPTTLYAGTTSGVLKSTNGGASWTVVNTGMSTHSVELDIVTITIDPRTPTTLYAGALWGSLFKTTNGAANWTPIMYGYVDALHVPTLVIDPNMPSTIYYSDANASTNISTVYKSTDGGKTWTKYTSGLPVTRIYTLKIDPSTSTLYAGTQGSGLFQVWQAPPSLAVSCLSGSPGSSFTVTGSKFPFRSTVSVSINGIALGTVQADSSGALSFILKTGSETAEGAYWVTASVPVDRNGRANFILDADAPTCPLEESAAFFTVPDGIAFLQTHLPFIAR